MDLIALLRGAFLRGATDPTVPHCSTMDKGRDGSATNDQVCFLFPSASLRCLLALLLAAGTAYNVSRAHGARDTWKHRMCLLACTGWRLNAAGKRTAVFSLCVLDMRQPPRIDNSLNRALQFGLKGVPSTCKYGWYVVVADHPQRQRPRAVVGGESATYMYMYTYLHVGSHKRSCRVPGVTVSTPRRHDCCLPAPTYPWSAMRSSPSFRGIGSGPLL